MSDPDNEVTLADLLAEYDPAVLRQWLREQEQQEQQQKLPNLIFSYLSPVYFLCLELVLPRKRPHSGLYSSRLVRHASQAQAHFDATNDAHEREFIDIT